MSHEAAEIEAPLTGIGASEVFVKALARIAAAQGANIVTRAEATRLEPLRDGICIVSEAGEIEG